VKPGSEHHDFIFEIIQVVQYMIKVEQINAVRKFQMARSFLGRVLYFTAAYWVDGMMVDTGCAYTVQELVTWHAKFHVGRTQWNSFFSMEKERIHAQRTQL